MNFQNDVIKRSHEIPVLVDFWAPWCGPCKYIGPVLEDLAEIQKEKWKLVKVNVDENQELSTQFRIRGIPAIKLFHKGKVIAEFGGAMPKPSVEKWLTKNLPDPYEERLENIIKEPAEIPDASLIEKLTAFIEENPDNKLARITLAKHLVLLSPSNAINYIEDIHLGDEYYDLAQHIRNLERFLITDYHDQSEIGDLMEEAKFDLIENDFESVIEKIIETNILDKTYKEDLPRLTAIAIFEILGKNHEVTMNYRRKFDMVLY